MLNCIKKTWIWQKLNPCKTITYKGFTVEGMILSLRDYYPSLYIIAPMGESVASRWTVLCGNFEGKCIGFSAQTLDKAVLNAFQIIEPQALADRERLGQALAAFNSDTHTPDSRPKPLLPPNKKKK